MLSIIVLLFFIISLFAFEMLVLYLPLFVNICEIKQNLDLFFFIIGIKLLLVIL